MTTEYVSGAYLQENTVEDRDYQSQLVNAASTESTLIGLPTGAGKTPVAIRLAMTRLDETDGRVLMLAPTNPLVRQHRRSFLDMTTLPEQEVQVFNGDVPPEKRKTIWKGQGRVPPSVVIATPQVIKNDIEANRYDLEDITHLIVDECHNATGDYAYVPIGKEYNGNARNPLVTGLSASPGSNKDKILEVCENLGITNVEIITEDDEILAKYLGDTDITYRYIDMPDVVTDGADLFRRAYKDAQKPLKKDGVLGGAQKHQSFGKIQAAQGKISQRLQTAGETEKSRLYHLMSKQAEAAKLYTAIDKLETQGVEQAQEYLIKLNNEAEEGDTKASKRIVNDDRVQQAYQLFRDYDGIHPKLPQVAMEVADAVENDGKALVFTESRETVQEIVEFLSRNPDLNVSRFVGQSDKENDPGMSQSEQRQVLDDFETGGYDVLVSTSVAEEGLDIPAVDKVVFYEPIPDAVRSIQRRGRTGRETDGEVIVMVGEGTKDQSNKAIAQRQEDSMKEDMKALKDMEDELNRELNDAQEELAEEGATPDVDEDAPTVYIDHREGNSMVPTHLRNHPDVRIEMTNNLEVGDYVVSDRVAVERKAIEDFFDTLTGERGFDQIAELVDNYDRPVVAIEANGPEDLYGERQIPEEAIRSALEAIAIDFGATLLYVGSEEELANQLATMARREQEERDQEVNPHGNKSTSSVTEQQVYIVSSIEDIGPATARNLLETFGDVESVFTASKNELMEVEKVGEKRAEQIRDVLTEPYP